MWKAFACKTLGAYHDLYVVTDVPLLADVYENFQKGMPGKIRAGPGALLQLGGPELGRAPDKDRRRARAHDKPRHAPLYRERDARWNLDGEKTLRKENNPLVEGYDPSKPTNYITYLDATTCAAG